MSHAMAYQRASRPKPAKLHTNLALRAIVQDDLTRRFSPEQIAGRLRRRFPEDPEMWVSTETVYQSLYVQSRGALKRELTRYLRTGRSLRKPGRQPAQRKNRIPDMINISQRPPEADDRAVPGHWEGDLLIGKRNATAIATLVERASGFAMLVALPDGYKPEHVAPALATKVQTLPDALRRSLTWDQGPEMRDWKQLHIDAAIWLLPTSKRRAGHHPRTATPATPARASIGRVGSPSGLAFAPTDAHTIKRPGRFPQRAPGQPRVAITARTQGSLSGTPYRRLLAGVRSGARRGVAEVR